MKTHQRYIIYRIRLVDSGTREMVLSGPTTAVTKIELVFKQSPNMDGGYFRMPTTVADFKIHYSAINRVENTNISSIFLVFKFNKKSHLSFLYY